jgi:hypothetical protein
MTAIHATDTEPTNSGRWIPRCACGWVGREYTLRRDARQIGARHCRNETLAEMEDRRRHRNDDAGDA